MNYIEKLWDSFRDEVLMPEASEIEIAEARKVFYCGALGLHGIILSKLQDPNISDDEGRIFVRDLDNEIKEFQATLLKEPL
jgi:hypothetical protein